MKRVKEMMKFILKSQIPLIPIVIIMLIYTKLYSLDLQVDELAIILVYFGTITSGLFGCLSFVHGLSKIKQSLESKKKDIRFIGLSLFSILLSGFILYSSINTILTTTTRAEETFPSLFVTEMETYPIEKIKLKKGSESLRTGISDLEVFYIDKKGEIKSVTLLQEEVDVDIYNTNNTKQSIQITKKYIPKTVAEKYNIITNYKFYEKISYKIVENIYQKGKNYEKNEKE